MHKWILLHEGPLLHGVNFARGSLLHEDTFAQVKKN